MIFCAPLKKNPGFTLIEALVSVALFAIILLAIYGIIQISFQLMSQAKARVTATALANQKIETARNLPYSQIGTIGGVPSGTILENETKIFNGVEFNVKTTVTFVDDPLDGTFPTDTAPWDYKRIKINVSWTGFMGGSIALITDIAAKGLEDMGNGGAISVLVFDANGNPVPEATIHIENPTAAPPIDALYNTNAQGKFLLIGTPACDNCYKITVSKSNYSQERTYAVGEIINGKALAVPAKPYVSVIANELSEISFAIDRLSAATINTVKYSEEKIWSDSFEDQTKIGETFQSIASTTLGLVELEKNPATNDFYSEGYLISTEIIPASLLEWGRLNWNDNRPLNTSVKYHLLYSTSSSWELIPDSDLTVNNVRNSDGFENAPVDLSNLNPTKYTSIKIKAVFKTTDPIVTPALFDWQITWLSASLTPLPNLMFSMTGSKSLGTDSNNNQIYKYQTALNTNNQGLISVNDLEWDDYKITVNGAATGYDLANSYPAQPVKINPGSSQTIILQLADHQQNTLLVTLKDAANQPLVGASVRLYRTGYDKLKLSTNSGQTFFSPLLAAEYTAEIKMANFSDWLGPIDVLGQTEKTIILVP